MAFREVVVISCDAPDCKAEMICPDTGDGWLTTLLPWPGPHHFCPEHALAGRDAARSAAGV